MSEVIVRSIVELREAYLAAMQKGNVDEAQIFKLALLERLERLSANIGRDKRAASPNE